MDLVDFNFNFEFATPVVLLLIPIMALPLTHLFISTSRMKKGALTAGANRVSTDDDDNVPMDRPRIPFRAMRSTFLWALGGSAAFLLVVMFFAGHLVGPGSQKGAGRVQYSGPDSDGEIDLDYVLTVDETGFREWPFNSGEVYFVSPSYSMVNDECGFILFPVIYGISGVSGLTPRQAMAITSAMVLISMFSMAWAMQLDDQIALAGITTGNEQM